jgi:striatin 1/3/4
VATSTPFHYTLVHSIQRESASGAAPTCISPLSPSGENFVVSYTDSSVLIFDTRTGEEIIGMASNETYDGTLATSINAVVATSSASLGLEAGSSYMDRADQEESVGAGPTGSAQGVEGVIVSGHEDRYIRFFDANSGMFCFRQMSEVSFANLQQGNARIQCSHILRPFHHYLCPKTVEKQFQQVMTHRSGSGRLRRDSARRISHRTDP